MTFRTFAISWRKLQSYIFCKLHIGLWKHAKNHVSMAFHYGETTLKKIENLVLFGAFWKFCPFISKIRTADIFSFLSVKYFDKGLLILKRWRIRLNYCWNYGPSTLLFRFFPYRQCHLNNRQTKVVENSKIHFLKANTKTSGEISSFFHPPTTKWRSFKFYANLNGYFVIFPTFKKLLSTILWKNV